MPIARHLRVQLLAGLLPALNSTLPLIVLVSVKFLVTDFLAFPVLLGEFSLYEVGVMYCF